MMIRILRTAEEKNFSPSRFIIFLSLKNAVINVENIEIRESELIEYNAYRSGKSSVNVTIHRHMKRCIENFLIVKNLFVITYLGFSCIQAN